MVNLSELDRGLRKFNGRARSLDPSSIHASGKIVSDPPITSLSKVRENVALTNAADSHDAWRMSAESVSKLWKPQRRGKGGFSDDMDLLPEELTDTSSTSGLLLDTDSRYTKRYS